MKRGAKRRREGPKKKTEREREERQREREREREGERERERERDRAAALFPSCILASSSSSSSLSSSFLPAKTHPGRSSCVEGRHVCAWIVIIFRSRERKEGEREVRREGKRSRERERERERKPSKGRPLVSLLSLLLSPRRRRLLAAGKEALHHPGHQLAFYA